MSLPEKMMVAAVGLEREREGEAENAGSGDDRRATRRSGKESRDEMKGERMSTDNYSVKMNR
jgi:hypothetical protein